MQFHGGSIPLCSGQSRPQVRDDFRNIFGDAPKNEVFVGFGQSTSDERTRTRAMLHRLALRIGQGHEWPDGSADNHSIPAGYTYLAQLAAHDLVQNLTPLPAAGQDVQVRRNLRSFRLMLDTIYGGGPEADPTGYEIPERSRADRVRLRVGRAAEHQQGPAAKIARERDLPRTACPHLSGYSGKGTPDVLVADPRNDDNLILAQLAALFHLLHNKVHEDIGELPAAAGLTESERFLEARKVVTLIYRRILFKDLLPRLLNTTVFACYDFDNPACGLIDRSGDDRIPLEFSHAAYRIGHAMVRPGYKINNALEDIQGIKAVIRQTSAHKLARRRLMSDWLVQWSHFFRIDGSNPNLSRKIGPAIARSLVEDDLFPPPDDGVQPVHPLDPTGGLVYRDLVRGAEAGLRTVKSIIEKLPPELVNLSPLLECDTYRRDRISAWLTEASSEMPAEDAATLAEDPPLLFFLLFEAADFQDLCSKHGARLGPLGSTILAEVFFSELARTRPIIEGDPDLCRRADSLFPAGIPEDMPTLIKHIATRCGLEAEEHMFL